MVRFQLAGPIIRCRLIVRFVQTIAFSGTLLGHFREKVHRFVGVQRAARIMPIDEHVHAILYCGIHHILFSFQVGIRIGQITVRFLHTQWGTNLEKKNFFLNFLIAKNNSKKTNNVRIPIAFQAFHGLFIEEWRSLREIAPEQGHAAQLHRLPILTNHLAFVLVH